MDESQLTKGFLVGKYPEESFQIIGLIQSVITNLLSDIFPQVTTNFDISKYHTLPGLNDEIHANFHYMATKKLHELNLFEKLMRLVEKDLISLLGPDLDMQRFPHLRISRPNVLKDNLGLHRDIDYGASIYEISVWSPLCKLFYPNAGMKILPDSNLSGYQGFELEESETGIAKGSKENVSGYLYKSKSVKLTDDQINKLIEPEVNIGQYLVIPQASVHGSTLNESTGTRFSVDIRFCNSNIVDDRSTLLQRRTKTSLYGEEPYYKSFTRSQIYLTAQEFLSKS
jgi:hypothetical protein